MEEMTNYLMTVSRRVCWVWTPPFLKHSLSCLPEPRQLLLLFHPALAFLCKCPLLTLPLLPSHFLSELSVAPRPTLSSLSMTISTCSTASIAVCILMLSILLSGVLTFHLSSRVIYAIKSPFTSHRNLKLKTSSTQAMSLHLSWCTPPPVLLFSVMTPHHSPHHSPMLLSQKSVSDEWLLCLLNGFTADVSYSRLPNIF